jgi:hypothetical protein
MRLFAVVEHPPQASHLNWLFPQIMSDEARARPRSPEKGEQGAVASSENEEFFQSSTIFQ